MSVTCICGSYFSWSGTLHQVGWLRCLLLVEYHNKLIREQMPTDQKMKCEQWTAACLFLRLSRSDLHDSDHQQVGTPRLSLDQLWSCMRTHICWWIRAQRNVFFHVVSRCAWAGSHCVCDGWQLAQMSLKSPRCNQSQLSFGASPHPEYSPSLFSPPHQQCQGSRLSLSFSLFVTKPSMEVCG